MDRQIEKSAIDFLDYYGTDEYKIPELITLELSEPKDLEKGDIILVEDSGVFDGKVKFKITHIESNGLKTSLKLKRDRL